MSRFPALLCCAVLSLFALSGCVPGEDDHVDETRDPNFQRGRALVLSQDFHGAIEEYEKAIEVNPRSASAHFELAWLSEEKTKDFAAAIYHYQKHLELRPNSPNSEDARRAKEHIQLCKRELARAEFAPPNTMALQREIDRLNAENQILRQNIDTLRTQLSTAISAKANTPEPRDISAVPPSARPVIVNPPPTRAPAQTEVAGANSSEVPRGMQQIRVTGNPLPTQPIAPMGSPHSHIIKSGETLASIANLYHIKLNALVQANPNINPKKLKVGQTVNLPTQ